MYNKLKYIFILFALGFGLPVFSLQNIVNVPSSEVLPQGQIIMKESTRVVPDDFVRLTPSVIYGLGGGFELSAGVGTTLESDPAVRGDFGIKKVFHITKSARFTTGARIQPPLNQSRDADTFVYAHVSQRIRKTKTSVTAGVYATSRNDYIPSHAGALLGIEQVIVPNKLRIAMDYLARDDQYSTFAVGLKYRPVPTLSITTAVLMSPRENERIAFNISVSKFISLKKRSNQKKEGL